MFFTKRVVCILSATSRIFSPLQQRRIYFYSRQHDIVLIVDIVSTVVFCLCDHCHRCCFRCHSSSRSKSPSFASSFVRYRFFASPSSLWSTPLLFRVGCCPPCCCCLHHYNCRRLPFLVVALYIMVRHRHRSMPSVTPSSLPSSSSVADCWYHCHSSHSSSSSPSAFVADSTIVQCFVIISIDWLSWKEDSVHVSHRNQILVLPRMQLLLKNLHMASQLVSSTTKENKNVLTTLWGW